MLVGRIPLAGLCGACHGADNSRPAAPATPTNVVTLSAAAVSAAGIQTGVIGQLQLRQALTLTGTLAERPWTPQEQTALSEAEAADANPRLTQPSLARLSHP